MATTHSESETEIAALRDSEARFRAFVTASTDVVYRMNPDWSELQELDGRGFLVSADAPHHGWLDDYLFAEDQASVRKCVAQAIESVNCSWSLDSG